MASPPYATSPMAMSPPAPSPAPAPSKRRSSAIDSNAPPGKRRKASVASTSSTHPLRQTSFPSEGRSPAGRSPSVDTASHVSGSVASGTTNGQRRKGKKRGRKSKKELEEAGLASQTPSVAGGKAATNASGQNGDKDGEEDDDDEKAEMAVEDVGATTDEQKQEEIRLRAMLVEAFDSEQYDRYELWRAAKLSDAVVKRVVNATVSQSVPQMVSTAVKAVSKLFAGEIIESARRVQAEWILAGEKQTDLPTPPPSSNDLEDENGEEKDLQRGPLRPDHLREAWRRYKLSGESHGVGAQQLWHNQQSSGGERFSSRTGRRMFR